MKYLTLKDTVRIKKAAHCCRVSEITMDVSMDVPPIMAYMLSLCNGMADAELISRCMSLTWGISLEKALVYVKKYADDMWPFLYFREEPELVQTRYKLEDFVYGVTPLKSDMRWETPANASLVLTDRCNFKCIYCYNSSGESMSNNLTEEQWLAAVDQLLEQGVTKFTLTGGEPMLHPGFFNILQRIINGGALAYICTNGSMIDKKAVKRFIDLRQPVVQISLDSATADVHHRMTLSNGSFSKVTKAIEMLADAGIRVNVKGLVMPDTYKDVPELIRLCNNLGAKSLILDSYDICLQGRGNSMFQVTEEMADEIEYMGEETTSESGVNIGFRFIRPKRKWGDSSDIVICGALSDGLSILSDGEFTLCEKTAGNSFWHFGNFPEMSIEEFWNLPDIDRKMHPSRNDFEKPCRNCENVEKCNSGCFANKQFVTELPYAADPYCWKIDYEKNPF